MADRRVIANMQDALAERAFPTMVMWNRLEGRPRTHDFDRALAAEIRDALWMLTRQWQLGEFRGDDAGSPLTVQLQVDRQPFTRLQHRNESPVPLDPSALLEPVIERRPVPGGGARDGIPTALDLRLLLGRHWLRTIADLGVHGPAYRAAYAVDMPDPQRPEHAALVANVETWQAFTAAAGRGMDGWRFFEHLQTPGALPYDGVSGIAASEHQALEERAGEFLAWVPRLLHRPADTHADAWEPDRLEYRFSCAAGAADGGGEQVFTADEYVGGSLDWYDLNRDDTRASLSPDVPPTSHPADVIRQATVPVPARFQGMPATRWWELEDGRTNFGQIRPDTTDLAKLLLVEFGLVYANDWFVTPLTLPVGSMATMRGLVVTNTFGERLWIESVNRAAPEPWHRFSLFAIAQQANDARTGDSPLVLLPTAPHIQDGRLLEDVAMVRDEVANMVWGIERTITLPSGEPIAGAAAGRAVRTLHERLLRERLQDNPGDRLVVPATAPVRYRVTTTVPEEWIPFIPVGVPGDSRSIQLQRGAMPRTMEGDPDDPVRIRPQTSILRTGLDESPRRPYLLHEEEVPRAGARVTARYRRTRGPNGVVVVWRAMQKETGRGDASSGLAFDLLVPAPEER